MELVRLDWVSCLAGDDDLRGQQLRCSHWEFGVAYDSVDTLLSDSVTTIWAQLQ